MHDSNLIPTRRQVLCSLASTAIASLFPALPGRLAAAEKRSGWVDIHHHFVPPRYFTEARASIAATSPIALRQSEGWSVAQSLAAMDQAGVATSVLSLTTPGVWLGDLAQARRLARLSNEYAAELKRDHTGRFGSFAVLPLPDVDGSLAEIAYAFDTLRADGIGIMTSYDDKWLGDAAFAPVLAELNGRSAVVYVHPVSPVCCRKLVPEVPVTFTELPQDTTRTITSLLFSGSFARYPRIRFIFSHAGGTIPMLAGRIAELAASANLTARLPESVEATLQRQHYEVANSTHRSAFAALTSLVPTSQILFGTDFPFVPIEATAHGLEQLRLDGPSLQAIARGNARRLLPKLS